MQHPLNNQLATIDYIAQAHKLEELLIACDVVPKGLVYSRDIAHVFTVMPTHINPFHSKTLKCGQTPPHIHLICQAWIIEQQPDEAPFVRGFNFCLVEDKLNVIFEQSNKFIFVTYPPIEAIPNGNKYDSDI